MKKIFVNFQFFAIFLFCSFQNEILSDTILSWDEAISRTLEFSPTLRIAQSEMCAKYGTRIQTSLYPNPTFSWDAQNIYGNRFWRSWDEATCSYRLNQLIELGEKRGLKIQAAKSQYYIAQAEYQIKQFSAFNHLLTLFTSVAALQEYVHIASEQTRIADEIFKILKEKVEAGEISLIQQKKSEISLSKAQINFEKVQQELQKSKKKLSNGWGASSPDFDRVCFSFYEIQPPKCLNEYESNLRNNPEAVKSQMEYLRSQNQVKLEKSLAIPDLNVIVGYKTHKHLKKGTKKGMIIGASMPLPIFNRNQGNIQTARAIKIQKQEKSFEVEMSLENKLSHIHQELVKAYEDVEQYKDAVLCPAIQTYQLTREGCLEGKYAYLDMLETYMVFLEAKEKYIQALLHYHHSFANIEYLIL